MVDLDFLATLFSEMSVDLKTQYIEEDRGAYPLEDLISSKKKDKFIFSIMLNPRFFQDSYFDRFAVDLNFLKHLFSDLSNLSVSSKDTYFQNARVSEALGRNVNVPISYFYDFLLFLVEELTKKTPTYLNHFLYKNENDNNAKFELSKTVSGNILNVISLEIDSDLLTEIYIFFNVKIFNLDCEWFKIHGQFGKIYKHHYIKFGKLICFEHDVEGVRIDYSDNQYREGDLIENSQVSGVSSEEVFKRVVARYANCDQFNYFLLRNNCEHYSTYAFYGAPRSRQVRAIAFISVLISLIVLCFLKSWQALLLLILLFFIPFLIEIFVYFLFSANASLRRYISSYSQFPK